MKNQKKWNIKSRKIDKRKRKMLVSKHTITQLCFSLRKDILNHKDIFFFNNDIIFFIINIYLDKHQMVLKYLKNIKVNICNILVITEDFNIRNRDWNLSYPYYLAYSNILMKVADSFNLKHSFLINQVSTWYANNPNSTNSVLDLIFFQSSSNKIDNYLILPESRSFSDHISLTVDISINEDFIQDK